MVASVTANELIARIESKTQSTAAAFANWDATRKLELLNEGIFETFKLLVSNFEWVYFVAIDENVTPASNTINLDGLSKPYYRLLAFSKSVGDGWTDVNIRSVRDVHSSPRTDEGWYEIGKTLRSDNSTSLSGPYRLVFNYRPTPIESSQLGSITEIDDEFVDMPVIWAVRECFSDAKMMDDYAKMDGQWERRAARMKVDGTRRNANQQTRIIDKMGWARRAHYIGNWRI